MKYPQLLPAALVGVLAFTTTTLFAQEAATDEAAKAADLAKQLQNPVASLISVPFQSNFLFNLGPNDDGFKYQLNFQPVIPLSLNKDTNLIIRTIVPVISQNDVIPGTSQTGLGDITQSFFFSPKQPVGGLILGFGPVLLWPSATDSLLGSEKWGAGPTALVLKQTGGWTVGLLANQIWSYAGNDSRNYVNSTFLQPFVSYTTKTKTTFGLNTESTYDWHDSQWTMPINLSVSQLVKIGKLPLQFQIGGGYFAEAPRGGPDWSLRFTITPLFPTGKKAEAAPASLTK